MEQRTDDGLSPYHVFSRAEWASRREDTPMTLTPDEVTRVRSLHDRLDIKEVEDIYLPLTRLLVALRRGYAASVPGAAELPGHRRRQDALHHWRCRVSCRRQIHHRARAAGVAGALAQRSEGRSGHDRRLSLPERHSGARRPDGEEGLSRKATICPRCCGSCPM